MTAPKRNPVATPARGSLGPTKAAPGTVAPPAVAPPARGSDLEARVEYRKRELISEIVEHKKNSSRAGAAEAIERAKDRLTELAHIVKQGPSAKLRLDEWMAR